MSTATVMQNTYICPFMLLVLTVLVRLWFFFATLLCHALGMGCTGRDVFHADFLHALTILRTGWAMCLVVVRQGGENRTTCNR
ncbi:unnamed protein product [Sphacelaria rigidula]